MEHFILGNFPGLRISSDDEMIQCFQRGKFSELLKLFLSIKLCRKKSRDNAEFF